MILLICSYLSVICYTCEPCEKATLFLCKANAHRDKVAFFMLINTLKKGGVILC
ncbi:hypothetical protein EMIT0180MI3_370002 [Priestia megaterium]